MIQLLLIQIIRQLVQVAITARARRGRGVDGFVIDDVTVGGTRADDGGRRDALGGGATCGFRFAGLLFGAVFDFFLRV